LSKNTITAFDQERYKNLAGFAQAKAVSASLDPYAICGGH
jgi:hypothetical protein